MTTQARELAGIISNAGDLLFDDDVSLQSDGAVLNFGADSEVTVTHVHNTGLLVNSTKQLQFGDSGTYINQSADGVLNITSDTEVEINATTIDINGNVDVSGNIVLAGTITVGDADDDNMVINANVNSHIIPNTDDTFDLGSASQQWRNVYVDGTLEADAITVADTALAEYIADTAGAMFSSNTETGITATYQDGDNTIDLVVGTLNQDTTGTADNVTVSANNTTDETVYPVFVDGATGSQGIESDTGFTYNPSSGVVTATQFTGALNGALTGNASGTAATVTTAAQPAITSLGTLTTLTVDEITINADTITATDDFIIDAVGDINLDADGADIILKDGGTSFLEIDKDGDNARLKNPIADGDIKLQGVDGSSTITALSLDMSDAGTATFNSHILLGNTVTNVASNFADQTGIGLKNSATVPELQISSDTTGFQVGRTSTGGSGQIMALRAAGTTKHSFTTTGYDLTGTLTIDQDANSHALVIDSEATSGQGISIDGEQTTGSGIMLDMDALTTGSVISANSNSSSTSTRSLVSIINDHASATGTTALLIRQDSNNLAINIDNASTTTASFYMTSKYGMQIVQDISGGKAARFERNIAEAGSEALVEIIDDHTSNTQPALKIQQDGTGPALYADGNVGIGVVPEANWASDVDVLQVGGLGAFFNKSSQAASSAVNLSYNVYDHSSTGQAYIVTDEASMYQQDDGSHYFYSAASGSADAAITWKQVMEVGTQNVLIGNSAGEDYTGSTGVYIGANAGIQATSAAKNVVIGDNANSLGVTTGDNNVVIGFEAGDDLTGGWSNMLIGKEAGRNITDGTRNICLGADSGATISTASENVFIGNVAGAACQSGGNVAIGSQCFESGNFSAGNVGVGWSTGEDCTGTRNTLLGAEAARQMTSSDDCTAVGHNAMGEGTATGNLNVAVGRSAMKACTSGAQNVAVGAEALDALQDGTNNTALGYEAAGKLTSGGDNVAIGRAALLDTTSTSGNVAVGVEALENNTGGSNTAVGKHALRGNLGGTQNVGVGTSAGQNVTTGNYNICVGHDARTSAVGSSAQIVIGANLTGTANNAVFIGTSAGHSRNDFLDDADWDDVSDVRKKTNIEDSTLGLQFLNKLRPVIFNWKSPSELPEEWQEYDADDTTPITPNKKIGLIAQEVKEVIDELGITHYDGTWGERENGQQELAKTAYIVPLIKAVQELSAKNEKLEARIATLEG